MEQDRKPKNKHMRKKFRCSRRISRGVALHRKGERNSRVVPPFPESPRCLSPFQGNLFSQHCLDCQAEDRLTPRWLLMKVKEESEKVSLKLNIQKTKIMASGPITSCQIDGETVETVRDYIFRGSKTTAYGDCSHEIIIIIFYFTIFYWFCHTST